MSMSKKDFIELADVLRLPGMMPAAIRRAIAGSTVVNGCKVTTDHLDEAIYQAVAIAIAGELADFCKSQNGAFKRDRWIAYINGECGPNGGEVKGGRHRAA